MKEKSFDPIPWIIGITTVVVIGLALFFANSSSSNAAQPPLPFIDGTPKLSLSDSFFPLTPKVILEQKDITVTNNGDGTLLLNTFQTSSDRIYAKYHSATQTSPKFTSKPNDIWKASIAPGEDGVISVYFKKDRINWNNPEDEYVAFKTNDPKVKREVILFSQKVAGKSDESTKSQDTKESAQEKIDQMPVESQDFLNSQLNQFDLGN